MPDNVEYHLLDVFTDRAFAGNPLAVFPAATGLETTQMQAIATELNLSETVFVGQPSAPNRFPLRIFTPTVELPFAGHPTVGTAHLLAALERVERGQPLTLEAGIGPLEVTFDANLARFTTARPVAISASSLDRGAAAALLGLDEQRIVGEPVLASCGLAFHLVELDSLETLASAVPAPGPWARWITPSGEEALYLYVSEETTAQGGALRSRMFSMEGSVREDPATGSAAAALAGTLATRRSGDATWHWRIDQGVEMGRPSCIHAEVERDAGGATAIRIAGQAVIVGRGTIHLGG